MIRKDFDIPVYDNSQHYIGKYLIDMDICLLIMNDVPGIQFALACMCNIVG